MPCRLRRGMTLQCYSDAGTERSAALLSKSQRLFDKSKKMPDHASCMIRFTVSSAAYAIRLSGEGGVPLWSLFAACAEARLIAAAISSLTSSTVTPLFCATNSSARSAAAMSNFISSFPFSGCGLIRTSTVLVSTILTPRKRKYCRNKGREKEQTVNKTKIDCRVRALRHALQRCAPHTAVRR